MIPSWFQGTLLECEQWVLTERALELLKAATALLAVALVMAVGTPREVAATASDVVGMGWITFGTYIGCVTCLAGAGLIVASGPGAILTALYYPGGAYIAASCVATCLAAVS